MGGELGRLQDGNVEYRRGTREGISVGRGISYDDFVLRVCQKMRIDLCGATFAYTLPFDLLALIPLRTDEDLSNMFDFSECFARVYISTSCGDEVVEDDAIAVLGCNEAIVGSNTLHPGSIGGEEVTIQSYGFSQRCAESHVGALETTMFETAILGSGQTFCSAVEFRDAVYLMSIAGRFKYKFKRNCPQHMTVICLVNECPWKITARAVGATRIVQVNTFRNTHNHSLDDVCFGEPSIRAKRCGRLVDDVIRATPDYLPRQLCKDFHRQYGMQLSYYQGWHVKEKSKERIHGLPQFSYKLLPWLCDRLIETNPETVAEIRCSEDGHFQQLFVALAVSIKGFQIGCRPIISIDSSHMSGPYKGALFSASSYDADDGMFPLAYGLFTSENYEDWLWFLQQLKMVVGEKKVVIISDRHQGIIRSVAEVFGSEYHAYCYRHIKENFSSFLSKHNSKGRKGKDNALQMLDAVAYARLDCDYLVAMEMLRTFNPDLAKWVEVNSPEHWAMSKFPKMRWDKMTNNLAESFNSWLRHERHHNICVFFIEHMDKVGSLLLEHQSAITKWNGSIGPKTSEKIALNMANGENYPTHLYIGGSIKVSIGRAILDVDLKGQTCTCKAWQMSGLPCSHACAALRRMGLDVFEHVDEWFKLKCQEKIYSGNLQTLVTHDMPIVHADGVVRDSLGHIIPSLLPPLPKRPPGRPRKRRIESQFMGKKTVHCSRCNEAGHNRATCNNPLP